MIAAKMEQWWKDHGASHNDAEWIKFLQRFKEVLKIKHEELLAEHENKSSDGKTRFGMSKASGCTRASYFSATGAEREPLTGSTLATFHIGHMLEVMAFCTLERCGVKVEGIQKPVYIEPIMASASDGIITECEGINCPVVLSVKSTGYKMSGRRKGDFIRQGFAELPIMGVRAAQPSWWAQLQAEIYGHGLKQGMVLVVAKDMIKTMENDPYMHKNGSLTFYSEIVALDDAFINNELLPTWQLTKKLSDDNVIPAPMVLCGDRFAELPRPADVENGWGGPNKEVTGKYNPCFGCDFNKVCARYA